MRRPIGSSSSTDATRVAVFRDPLVEEPPGLRGIGSLPIDDTGVWTDPARLLTAAGPVSCGRPFPADGDSFVPTPCSSGDADGPREGFARAGGVERDGARYSISVSVRVEL